MSDSSPDRFVEVPPQAGMLIESMRDVGYSLETALADIVDNSIAAGATEIQIFADTSGGEPHLAVIDDGEGLTEQELLASMQLGSRNPLAASTPGDLGRFGLGLKTASFSQCRRLSVVSRRGERTSAAVWDLDLVGKTNRWEVLIPRSIAAIPHVASLGPRGTAVVWERLDRALRGSTGVATKHFVRALDDARAHLERVFHRFLAGDADVGKRLRISMNNTPLRPFDPFNSRHPATIRGNTENVRLPGGVVSVTPFTLPHHKNVSQSEWEHYAGRAGYLRNQGFYLYRGGRLIVSGTWFGLARQTELTKLARVRIDIPTDLDADWHVDIKKASASPPAAVRDRLQGLIREIGAPSRRIYQGRIRTPHDGRLPIWTRIEAGPGIRYCLNPENPFFVAFRSSLPPDLVARFDQLCAVVNAALPLDAIFADLAGSPELVEASRLEQADLRDLVGTTYATLLSRGVEPRFIGRMLQVSEPFRSNWEQTEELLISLEEKGRE